MELTSHKSPRLASYAKHFVSLLENPRWPISLALVLFIALAIRLINFTGVLDYDVLKYAYRAVDTLQGGFEWTLNVSSLDFRAGLILPLSFFYWIFGPSEFSTVLYSLLISLLGVALIYGIARILANESAGVVAALIWALFPLNVFLSTMYGPDEILATFTIAAVFFLVWGNKYAGTAALWRYGVGLLFGLLAIFVKPSAILIFAFMGLFFVYKILTYYRHQIQNWAHHNKKPLSIAIPAALILLISSAFVYLQTQQHPFLLSLFRASTDFADLLVLGKTEEMLPLRGNIIYTPIFLAAAPIFIVSLAGLMVLRPKGAGIVLLWACCLMVYFEWGSISPNPTVYAPLLAETNDRNVLFLFAPFAVGVGLLVADMLKAQHAYLLATLALCAVVPFAWWLKQSQFSGIPLGLSSLAVTLSILGAFVVSTTWNQRPATKSGKVIVGWLLVAFIAFLYPTPPLHISEGYWKSQVSYRRAVSEAVGFFTSHPDYPIITLAGDNARELNFLSSFSLGSSNYGLEDPDGRISVSPDPRNWPGSAYIFLRDEINQITTIPASWWKVAEYDPGSGRPMLIYRTLAAEEAMSELEAAKQAAMKDPTQATLEQLLGFAVNAGDAEATFEVWQDLLTLDAAKYPLDFIAPTILEAWEQNALAIGQNLLSPQTSPRDYEADEVIRALVARLQVDGTDQLTIHVPETLGGRYGVFTSIELLPESLYLFKIQVQSDMGIDLLAVDGGNVKDSHEYSVTYPTWATKYIVFVTPAWNGATAVRLDFLTVNKPGTVSFRDPQLYRVDFAQD